MYGKISNEQRAALENRLQNRPGTANLFGGGLPSKNEPFYDAKKQVNNVDMMKIDEIDEEEDDGYSDKGLI